MKIRRIDEDTVRCLISEEDMREFGLEIEDFFKDKEKIHEFLVSIVEKAKEEVGYEAENGMLAMQVMLLPNNGLSITFSEKADASFQGMLEHIKDAVGGLNELQAVQIANGEIVAEKVEQKISNEEMVKPKVAKQPMLKIFRFHTLKDVEKFCLAVETDKPIKSSLYKNEEEGRYYLVIEKGRNSVKLFNAICYGAIEFASFFTDSTIRYAYVEEHFQCLIPKKAIMTMRKIANG